MEVDAAGKDIGARETSETQLGTVGSTTDRFNLGGDACLLHGFEHNVNHMHIGVYLFLHVVVLVAQLNLDRALAILLVHTGSDRLDEVLAVFKLLAVVVADDVAQLGFLAVAVNAQQMVEALVAVGGLGDVGLGNEGVELASQTTGVDHLALHNPCVRSYP